MNKLETEFSWFVPALFVAHTFMRQLAVAILDVLDSHYMDKIMRKLLGKEMHERRPYFLCHIVQIDKTVGP